MGVTPVKPAAHTAISAVNLLAPQAPTLNLCAEGQSSQEGEQQEGVVVPESVPQPGAVPTQSTTATSHKMEIDEIADARYLAESIEHDPALAALLFNPNEPDDLHELATLTYIHPALAGALFRAAQCKFYRLPTVVEKVFDRAGDAKEVPGARTIDISGQFIYADQLAQMAKKYFTHVQELQASNGSITDLSAKALAFPKLQRLNLSYNKFLGNMGLKYLVQLPNLRELDLSGCGVTFYGIDQLLKTTRVSAVALKNCPELTPLDIAVLRFRHSPRVAIYS